MGTSKNKFRDVETTTRNFWARLWHRFINWKWPFFKRTLAVWLYHKRGKKPSADFNWRDCERVVFTHPTDSKNIGFPRELLEFYYDKIKNWRWTRAQIKKHFYEHHKAKEIRGPKFYDTDRGLN